MIEVDSFYSRLEISSDSNINFPGFVKDKCLHVKGNSYDDDVEKYNIYFKEFNDLNSVIECINQVEIIWKNAHRKGTILVDDYKEYERCDSILIYNQWKDYLTLNIYLDRWMLSGLSSLTNEWKENLKNAKGKVNEIYSEVLEWEINDECEFIPKQKACSLLENWLQTNERKGDFDYNKYYNYRHEYFYIYHPTALQDASLDFSESDNDDIVPF
jgi:hypothetical protein